MAQDMVAKAEQMLQKIRDYNAATLQQAAAGPQHLCYRQAGDNSHLLLQVTVAVGQAKGGAALLAAAARAGYGAILGVLTANLQVSYSVSISQVAVGEQFSKGYQDEIGEVDEAEVDEDGEDVIELQNARTTRALDQSVPAAQRDVALLLRAGQEAGSATGDLDRQHESGNLQGDAAGARVRKHAQQQGAAVAGSGGQVSSCHHVERLAAKAGTAEESPAAAVSDRAAYRNAPASERRRAGNKHAASVRNIHLSKHCLAEYAVLRVVVRAWQGAGDGADDVSTTAAAAARQGREGSGVLPQQAAV
ncbi:hypothetical protein OPT61_g4319 [Boeremia exigua]|uniref:Uncharacterized protein n=1 Tax=Boeremia exigua TaxID=749465 RepID=A0ACC2IEG8_9PLEO|nr:hypothetical protein OPT61_g4319 [Boeremia exigua]